MNFIWNFIVNFLVVWCIFFPLVLHTATNLNGDWPSVLTNNIIFSVQGFCHITVRMQSDAKPRNGCYFILKYTEILSDIALSFILLHLNYLSQLTLRVAWQLLNLKNYEHPQSYKTIDLVFSHALCQIFVIFYFHAELNYKMPVIFTRACAKKTFNYSNFHKLQ